MEFTFCCGLPALMLPVPEHWPARRLERQTLVLEDRKSVV